jgi:hypothetical protein
VPRSAPLGSERPCPVRRQPQSHQCCMRSSRQGRTRPPRAWFDRLAIHYPAIASRLVSLVEGGRSRWPFERVASVGRPELNRQPIALCFRIFRLDPRTGDAMGGAGKYRLRTVDHSAPRRWFAASMARRFCMLRNHFRTTPELQMAWARVLPWRSARTCAPRGPRRGGPRGVRPASALGRQAAATGLPVYAMRRQRLRAAGRYLTNLQAPSVRRPRRNGHPASGEGRFPEWPDGCLREGSSLR